MMICKMCICYCKRAFCNILESVISKHSSCCKNSRPHLCPIETVEGVVRHLVFNQLEETCTLESFKVLIGLIHLPLTHKSGSAVWRTAFVRGHQGESWEFHKQKILVTQVCGESFAHPHFKLFASPVDDVQVRNFCALRSFGTFWYLLYSSSGAFIVF